jgi:hypothetical protein
MSTDPARPGDVDLDTHTPEPTPAPEPVVEAQGDGDPTPIVAGAEELPADEPPAEPAPEPAAPPKRQATGMLADLLSEREKRQAERDARIAVETRLADLEQRIQRGELLQAPPRPVGPDPAVEQTKLEGLAKRLNLYKADGTPDLESARNAYSVVREIADEAVAPERQRSIAQVAQGNLHKAVTKATELGYSQEAVAVIQEEFATLMQTPGGQQMLAQPQTALLHWRQALGRAVMEGKLTPAQAGAASRPGGVTPPGTAPDMIPTIPGGRRAPQTTIALTPAQERIYRENGLDPSKGYQKPLTSDGRGGIVLE